MTENKRFTWEYSNYDYCGEIHDWSRSYNAILITDYLQKWELEEWCQELNKIVDENNQLRKENDQLKKENEELKQFKENVIKWVDSQMKFNVKKYIETEDSHFKSENIDLHNFKVFIGIDSND